MKRITNASIGNETEWDNEGLHFREICKQEYSKNNCIFSSGEVTGHPVDTLYICWQKDEDDGGMLLLRPDEMAAIAWICAGSLFSLHLGELCADGEKPAVAPAVDASLISKG